MVSKRGDQQEASTMDFSPWLGEWRRSQKHVNWFNYLAFWGMDEVRTSRDQR